MSILTPELFEKKVSKLDAAREALMAIERIYLRAAGFRPMGPDVWAPPLHQKDRYKYQLYRTGHAINALKVWDRNGRAPTWP